MKKLLAIAAVAVLSASMTACSDDSGGSKDASGSYCSRLENSKDSFQALTPDALDPDSFADTRGKIKDLQDAASGGIADDWATLGGSLDDLESAVDAAGISLDDVPQLITGNVPNGVDPGQAQQVVTALQKLGTDQDVQQAADAAKTCNVDLQDTSSD